VVQEAVKLNKANKTILIFLLALFSMTIMGCTSREIEENMNSLEEAVNDMEERGNRFFDELGESLEDIYDKLEESLTDFFEERNGEDSEDEGIAPLPQGETAYVSRSMEEAYGEIPMNYDFVFDQEAEDYIFTRLNDYREEKGLHPLERREDLTQSARYKSLAMLQYDYFSHDNPNLNDEPFDHLMWNKLDLKYVGIGENLAFVSNSAYTNRIHAEELFTGWQNSDGHNKQMLSPTHRYVGIGVVRSSESGPYYKDYKVLLGTQHFGN
jgi:uncharacterized protein YkwD